MLSRIKIDSFMRLALVDIAIQPGVSAFWGDNEEGKSTVGEAIRFALRGLSPRITRKSDFDMLVTTGRRSGSVEVVMDGNTIRRNVRDGAVTSEFTVNLADNHIDLQLGAEPFETFDRKELRKLVMRVLDVPKDKAFITARLKERGIGDDVLEEAIDLVFASGFDTAAKQADNTLKTKRGEWRGITGETYGHVKAEEWKHPMCAVHGATDADVDAQKKALSTTDQLLSIANKELGAAAQTKKLRGKLVDKLTVGDAKMGLDITMEQQRDHAETLASAAAGYQRGIQTAQKALRECDHAQAEARRAIATLRCPACDVALKAVMRGETPVLERAEDVGAADASLQEAIKRHEAAHKTVLDLQTDERETMARLRVEQKQIDEQVATCREQLRAAEEVSKLPDVPEGRIEQLTADVAALRLKSEEQRNELVRLQTTREQIKLAHSDTTRATVIHKQILQWMEVQKACGQGEGSIPAEMLAKTIGPINTVMQQISTWWGYDPVMLNEELSLTTHGGMNYWLCSESARWRMNACMQLALAALSKLKLVCIDRFDVLLATRRAAFFDMLANYAEAYPDVTVLTMGTLTAAPQGFPMVRFYQVANGGVTPCA